MKDIIITITKCAVCVALAAAAIWLAFNNGEDSEIFKVMTVAVVTYFFAQRQPPQE